MAVKKKPKATAKSPKRAAESGDPAVHQLLAERETARLNGDKEGMKAVDKSLAEFRDTESAFP